MTDLRLIAEGTGDFLKVDPDGYRAWVRDNKSRAMTSKLMSEKQAVEKLVADGDYLVYECNYLQRGPAARCRCARCSATFTVRCCLRRRTRTSGP